MSTQERPVIGVVGSPQTANALRHLGFKVVTAAGFHAAATAVSAALKSSSFPVVVAEDAEPGFRPWVVSTAKKHPVVVLGTRPDLNLETGDARRLQLPAAVDELLPLLGFSGPGGEHGTFVIEVEVPAAVVAPVTVPITAPLRWSAPTDLFDDDDDDEDDEPFVIPTRPAAAPALDQAFFTAPEARTAVVPAAVPSTLSADFFTAPAASAAPAPAAPADFFAAPTPAPVVQRPVRAESPFPSAPAALAIEVDEDLFDARSARHDAAVTELVTAVRATPPGDRCPLIFIVGAKGGIGKTTWSQMLAKVASEAGLRVVLVDGNRGQPDFTSYLRLPQDGLNTIYDAVRTGDPATAIIKPAVYNGRRPNAVDDLNFAIVQGPPAHHASPDDVSAETYAAVTDYARSDADLVIVDTQISEAHHSDLFDRFIIPSMASGAWSVCIVNESRAGADNLVARLSDFADRGVPASHTLILASMYEDWSDSDSKAITAKYGEFGTFIGSAGLDQRVKRAMNVGNFASDSLAISPPANAILYRVTGDEKFAPQTVDTASKRSWFGRKAAK